MLPPYCTILDRRSSGSFSPEIGISHLVRELTDASVKLQANGDIRDK